MGVLPDVLIDTEDSHPVQVGGIGVDEVAGSGHGDSVDQFPTHPEGFGGSSRFGVRS